MDRQHDTEALATRPDQPPLTKGKGNTSANPSPSCVTIDATARVPVPSAAVNNQWLTEALKVWCASPAIEP